MTSKQQQADLAAIRAMIGEWSRAVEAKDADAIVKDYTPETVLFDVTHPAVGADAIKAVWQHCFPYFPDKFRSEHQDLVIEVAGDVAFVYGFHRFVPEPADHPSGKFKMRVTVGLRRIDGKWRVLHEHVSIPFDMPAAQPERVADVGEVLSAADKAAAHGVHRLSPHLVCSDASGAIDFYKRAFGATELMRLAGPDGKLMHACLSINGSSVMLVDEYPSMGNSAPSTLKGTPVTMHLIVDDADAFAARAIAAGAKVVMPIADMFWGDRYGVIEDPFGHRWAVATPQRPVFGRELEEAASAAIKAHKAQKTVGKPKREIPVSA
jgi:uncharacterized protein (TIGR02246 family)